MGRELEIEITETADELKKLLHNQKSGRVKERIQVLFLLKTKQVATALMVANLIGRSYSTVKTWLRTYRKAGLKEMMEIKHGGGMRLSVPKAVLEQLDCRLKQREGFSSYKEIQVLLKEEYGLKVHYNTLHRVVHNRLNAKPKVVRPQSAVQDESKASDFEKKSIKTEHNGDFILH